ncbi:MAG: endonuclease/exonuclease/phosphatase family protein [Pseudomonadota bacterium]
MQRLRGWTQPPDNRMRAALWVAALMSALASPADAAGFSFERQPQTIRVATFNTDMNRQGAGVLVKDIIERDQQVLNVAEIILRVQPDIVLLNEIDYDPEGRALSEFLKLLAEGVADVPGLRYAHNFLAPSNTGEPIGVDLDGDGRVMGTRDTKGFGRFPGQYGMALLSRVPLGPARTFRDFPWSQIPWSQAPSNPDGTAYYPSEAWEILPVSSKSHWDVPAVFPDGRTIHLLASHPTPPVFDGPEDHNGLRNAAEIRFWLDHIDEASWIRDDSGTAGGLPGGREFFLLGDLNNDPADGDGNKPAIRALLGHARVQDPMPRSPGAAAAKGRISETHMADPAYDTAEWHETEDGPGNLRVDYVLPSVGLKVTSSGVFWPAPEDPLARLVAMKNRARASSDHRLVWVDIALEAE